MFLGLLDFENEAVQSMNHALNLGKADFNVLRNKLGNNHE